MKWVEGEKGEVSQHIVRLCSVLGTAYTCITSFHSHYSAVR